MGDSPERIAYFKRIMEEAPITEMTPEIIFLSDLSVPDTLPDRGSGDLIEELNNSIYTLFKEGEYYMIYTVDSAQSIELDLSGSADYRLEVIDTWNMKIVSETVVSPGEFLYETEMPFTAIRLIAK